MLLSCLTLIVIESSLNAAPQVVQLASPAGTVTRALVRWDEEKALLSAQFGNPVELPQIFLVGESSNGEFGAMLVIGKAASDNFESEQDEDSFRRPEYSTIYEERAGRRSVWMGYFSRNKTSILRGISAQPGAFYTFEVTWFRQDPPSQASLWKWRSFFCSLQPVPVQR